MKGKKYKAVIFDLDGTLLDTLEDLSDAINYVLVRHAFTPRSRKEVRRSLGNGILRLCRLCFPKDIPEEIFQQMFREFKEFYTAHCHIKTKPYNEIPQLLSALACRGYGMAIVSNKNEEAVKALQQDFFPEIPVTIGQSGNMRRKPAPDMVEAALRKLGLSEKEAVYVGDSEVDKATADAAFMDCILVTWGFRDRDEIEKMGASAVIDMPLALLDQLQEQEKSPAKEE